MGTIFLDIETSGLNFEEDSVILIQLQVDNNTIEYFISWDSNEEQILREYFQRIKEIQEKQQTTWCVGFNSLKFDIPFLFNRIVHYNIASPYEIYNILYSNLINIDLKQIFYPSNNWLLKGLTWSNVLKAYGFSPKISEGEEIPELYKKGNYDRIIDYVKSEFYAMIDVYWRVRKGEINKISE